MDKNNIIDPSLENDFEENQENDLRPQTLSEYIGQEKVKDNMKVFIEAAKKEGKLWTMFYYMVLRDLVRQLLQELQQMK